MKHLKIYENNNNNKTWIITQISNMGPGDYELYLFDDKESAENYFINIVNDAAIRDKYNEKIGYENDKNYIFTIDDAKQYNANEYTFELHSYGVFLGKFELPEELKLGRDTKKYNL